MRGQQVSRQQRRARRVRQAQSSAWWIAKALLVVGLYWVGALVVLWCSGQIDAELGRGHDPGTAVRTGRMVGLYAAGLASAIVPSLVAWRLLPPGRLGYLNGLITWTIILVGTVYLLVSVGLLGMPYA